ncbi:hypothetical protein PILCRDRAFT_79991 [Piloderma croceum F 1598]|uniref:Uncharacterized protein n=1 Tax=Piloderma croceum (strain F 1598) TaxID=765440 RepID=A0A0C3EPJ0_PILCF|nr:hypothetical protein PILCRDRAFT_79991 [Piloderma croceum F 1598]
MIWGPYVLSGVPRERRKWEQELMQRRVAEQLRIDDWENQFLARQHEEMVRQDEWERELMQRHVAEQSRIAIWEQQLEARKRQEKIRQDEWERSQKDIRREEAHRREQERRREEEWQLEEERRQTLGLHWDTPIADSNCASHNSREYWARLLNTFPFDYNWLKPCQEIPLVIHGRSLNTTRCYINEYVSGEVYGHWLVDFNEPLCSPYWDRFNDKGCTAEGSGRRRLEAHLENIHEGEYGEKLCSSTPYGFFGQHFDHPDSCANWGNDGIFGIWEISDSNC